MRIDMSDFVYEDYVELEKLKRVARREIYELLQSASPGGLAAAGSGRVE